MDTNSPVNERGLDLDSIASGREEVDETYENARFINIKYAYENGLGILAENSAENTASNTSSFNYSKKCMKRLILRNKLIAWGLGLEFGLNSRNFSS